MTTMQNNNNKNNRTQQHHPWPGASYTHKTLRKTIPEDFTFGFRVLDQLQERHMTIKSFCEQMELSFKTFYKIVRGSYTRLTPDHVLEFALLLDTSAVQLWSLYLQSLPRWRQEPEEVRHRIALMTYLLDTLSFLPTRDQEELELLVRTKVKMNKAVVRERRKELELHVGFADMPHRKRA